MNVAQWFEHIESVNPPLLSLENGKGVWFCNNDQAHYLACWPDQVLLHRVVGHIAQTTGIRTITLADDVRVRRAGAHWFAFNYGKTNAFFDPNVEEKISYAPVVGTTLLEGAGLAVWKRA